ncbi:MAG: transglutaminase domain-containing protein [Microbacteriaceae bacterium]|nr:MAG: transglutaminase domain-containing protein [Microbacteriaceae bacterium]
MALTDVRRPAAPAPAPRPGRPARRSRPAGDRRWVHALLVWAALASAFAGLHVTLQGLSWWFVGAGYAAAALVAGTAARSLLRSAFWAPIASFLVGIALLTLGYAADTAILGVVPTLDSVARFREIAESGFTAIVEQRVPATPELGIVMLLAVLMVFCAWLADVLLALRRPALVALPLAPLLLIPAAIRPELTDGLWFVVTAVLYLALLRVGARPDSRRVVLATGAAVVVGSLLLPYALPAGRDDTPVRTGGLRAGVNPLVTLGDDLRRGAPTLALSYTTSASSPVYLRLTTLDNFTGQTWGPTLGTERASGLEAFPDPPGYGGAVNATEAAVDVTVRDLSTHWLPLPYPTRSVEGAEGGWFWDPDSLAVRSVGDNAAGQSYTATFAELHPTFDQLRESTPIRSRVPPGTLDLPERIPEIITTTALEVAGDAASPYEQAIALQDHLRRSPFTYSEDTPVAQDFDGTGLDAIAVFLEVKSGYCVHYASAMAVMARSLGIPSRIAVGFQPGQRDVQRSPAFEVSTNDLHAWPELYFEGIGWLRFEPTPGRGSIPQYGADLIDDPRTPQDESSAAPLPTSTATPNARGDRDETPQTPEQLAAEQGGWALAALGVLAGAALVALIPAGFRTWVRLGRVRRMRRGRDPATAAWEEVRDTARDIGWSAPESETPRVFAERLTRQIRVDNEAIGAFRGSVESSAYGRPDAAVLSPEELRVVRRVILRSAGARTRLRAFLLPPSLLYRWRPDDA